MENPPPVNLDPIISCFVPVCKNRVLMCPGKYFFHVPKSTRMEWCTAVNKKNVPKSAVYICEDHLNLQEDLLNYQEWVNMAVRPRLKLQVPKTLQNIERTLPTTPTTNPKKEYCTLTTRQEETGRLCKPQQHNKTEVNPIVVHHSVRVNICKKKIKVIGDDTSPNEFSPSPIGSTVEYTETGSSSVPTKQKCKGRKFILNRIQQNPIEYLGLVKKYYWLIAYIARTCNIPSLHIILTLYKLKNNDTFKRMKDLFKISIPTLWRVFIKTIRVLSCFFRQILYWPHSNDIHRNLPPVFRYNVDHAQIQCMIDAFEIKIEKPKKPIQQSMTWSQNKQCYTLKYLIGATPDGFINFISDGHSGRISDMHLVEQSGFLECVPENVTILADRRFKHLESDLIKKSVKVLNPPSVRKDTIMKNSEVIDSKVIARLRIHIKRVIRRLRLFKLLKPNSVVNNKLVNILDDSVIIACGLNNLLSPLMKY